MRIARLEIFGFKSFLERFVLNFDQPIVGVVGPNGCGKSNIVDSLRWALGETHAKQLRGSTLEDVIFNGSDTRRPLGMAEVSITIRPEREWQPSAALQVDESGDAVASPEVSLMDQQSGITRLAEAVPGLFEASEIQITRRLYRSGESEYFINRVPCRLRDTVDLYRAIGLGSRGLSIVAQGQIGDLISKKPVDRRELIEDAAGISGFRVRLEASQRKLEQTATNISRLGDIIIEVEKQVVFLRRQAKRARSRNELKERERELGRELFAARASMILLKREQQLAQLHELRDQLEFAERSLSSHGAEEERYRSDIEQLDVRLSDERRVRDDINRILNDRAQAAHELHLSIAENDGKLSAIEGQLRLIDERKESIGIELERRKQAITSARSSLDVVEAKQREAEALQPDDATNTQLHGISEELTRARGVLSQKLTAVTKHQMELASKEGELKTLERQAAIASGQNDIGGLAGESIASALRVPEALEHAASAVLGPKARCVIVDSISAINPEAIERLQRSDSFWGAVERSTDAGGDYANQAHGKRRLIDSFEISDSARAAVEAVLGNVLLVETIAEGREALTELAHVNGLSQNFYAVTTEGELVFSWGVISPRSHDTLFALQRQIEDRRLECSRLEELLAVLREEANRGELSVAELETKRNSVISHKEQQVRGEVNKLIAEAASLSGLISFETERMNELRNELSKLASRGEMLIGEQRTVIKALEQLREDEGALLQNPELNEADLLSKRAATESEIVRLEGQKGELRVAFAELLQQLDSARRTSHELNARVGELTLATDRHQMELSMIHDDVRVRFGDDIELPTIEAATELVSLVPEGIEERIAELHSEADKLRHKLEREGEVDPQAIELYEAEEKRLEEMQTQLQDLSSAKETLERTIKELKEVSRIRFLETFEFVNAKFQELVPRLFGGGSGHLELVNPEDPLSSGVEMSVRPPGKKLRSMELLSGGEKALVAVALLMAMFLYRPSPICVLDEVDAPLDDANLERFLALIAEIASETQFLIITHNKQTMAAADKLIGITMQEKGVSTALAVSFIEAEKELERLVANQ